MIQNNYIVRSAPYVILTLLTGCAAAAFPDANKFAIDFLQDGQATKESVIRRLGQPRLVLRETILMYKLGKTSAGYFLFERAPDKRLYVGPYSEGLGGIEGIFHLVLVFDANNMLKQHALLQVQPTFSAEKTDLHFLQDSHTTKVDALFHLGIPTRVLMKGKVLTFRVQKSAKGYFVWEQLPQEQLPTDPLSQLLQGVEGLFQVVLVFDERDILQQHGLLQRYPISRESMTSLDFLQEGKSTKSEVLIHLGAPISTAMDERILTYRLEKTSGRYYVFGTLPQGSVSTGIMPSLLGNRIVVDEAGQVKSVSGGLVLGVLWGSEGVFDLVMTFDEQNVLKQYALSRVE